MPRGIRIRSRFKNGRLARQKQNQKWRPADDMLDIFKKQTIRDRVVGFSSPSALREPIFKLLAGNQKESAEILVMAPAVYLILVCAELDICVREFLQRAERVVKDADHVYSHHMNAVRDYIQEELK